MIKNKITGTVCIIPARGGSKRIPLKNIKRFNGKPIIYYSIKSATSSNLFDKVIVSTDNNKIAKIAKKFGAETHIISSQLADDKTDTPTVIRNVIKYLDKLNFSFNKVCCIYPTSVFFSQKDLHKGFKMLNTKKNYIFSATKYEHPIHRSFYKKKGDLVTVFSNMQKKRTQDLPNTFYDAAQFYFGWKKSWLEKKKIFSGKSEFIEIPRSRSQDIDNIEDWKGAENLWKFNKKTR